MVNRWLTGLGTPQTDDEEDKDREPAVIREPDEEE
jgi:hypothetical protein